MNVTDFLAERAEEAPNRAAFLTNGGELTFAELDRAVSWTARTLQEDGLAPGARIGIRLSNPMQNFIAFLAVARLGAGQISLHELDPAEVVKHMLAKLNIDTVISDTAPALGIWKKTLPPPPGHLGTLKTLKPTSFKPHDDSGALYVITRTSGTTALTPKLGYLSHSAGAARTECRAEFAPEERFLQLVSVEYFSAKENLLRCLSVGGCMIVLDGMNQGNLAETIVKHEIGLVTLSLTHANSILRRAPADGRLFPDFTKLKIGHTFIPDVLREQILDRLTPNLYINYGASEVSRISLATPDMVRDVLGVVGRPPSGVQVEIIDPEGRPLPAGEIGKIKIKSDSMIDRFLGDDGDHAGVIRDRWFYSEDMVSLTDEGILIHHGRADDVMIYDGINIFPAEIENALLLHPNVTEAAAYPIAHRGRGKMPAAAVTTNAPVSEAKLRAHCRHWLGERTPVRIRVRPALPKNAAGKVIKSKLS